MLASDLVTLSLFDVFPRLAQCQFLIIQRSVHAEQILMLLQWLADAREDGHPKMLHNWNHTNTSGELFIERVREVSPNMRTFDSKILWNVA